MLGRWDVDRTLSELGAFRTRVDEVFDALESPNREGTRYLGWASFPETDVRDVGDRYEVRADLPGVAADELDLQLTATSLTISGKRRVAPPEAHVAHRRERRSYQFSRSLKTPGKIDPDRATAELKNGALTIVLPKNPEAQPRRIAVQG